MRAMTIGKVAAAAGVGTETIRFYERRGLIERPPRPAGGGFRVYPQATVARVRFIRQAQGLGFSLAEAGELLSLRADGAADAGQVRARAEAKLAQVEAKLARLDDVRRALEALIAACPGRGPLEGCTVVEALERTRRRRGTDAEQA